MKKLLFLACLFIASCAHKENMVVDLNFELYKSALETNNRSIQVKVKDNRAYKEDIGQKIFGNTTIAILADQNLSKLLQAKILQNLIDKGFKHGNDFVVDVLLENFNYKSSRGFLVGKSKADGKIVVNVVNNINGEKFSKNYELSANENYFISSSKKKDVENINGFLQELLSDFLSDQDFLNFLKAFDTNDSSMERLLKRWYMLM